MHLIGSTRVLYELYFYTRLDLVNIKQSLVYVETKKWLDVPPSFRLFSVPIVLVLL